MRYDSRSWMGGRCGVVVVALLAGAIILAAGDARATYSIVAVDRGSQQVGGAGASCVGNAYITSLYGSVARVGALHAQAYILGTRRSSGQIFMQQGLSPAEIITKLTDPAFDGEAAERQYGIVDLRGRSAGFTGTGALAYAGHDQGGDARYTVSIQGNILTSSKVISQAKGAFLGAAGCDLASRLMLALEAGRQGGEGDNRCTPQGIPADSAFLQVTAPDGNDLVLLQVKGTAPADPVTQLRGLFNTWRASNPCTLLPVGGRCLTNMNCATGFCIGGLCCPSTCDDRNACTIDRCVAPGRCLNDAMLGCR